MKGYVPSLRVWTKWNSIKMYSLDNDGKPAQTDKYTKAIR